MQGNKENIMFKLQFFTLLPSVTSPLQMPSKIIVCVELMEKTSGSRVISCCQVKLC